MSIEEDWLAVAHMAATRIKTSFSKLMTEEMALRKSDDGSAARRHLIVIE